MQQIEDWVQNEYGLDLTELLVFKQSFEALFVGCVQLKENEDACARAYYQLSMQEFVGLLPSAQIVPE